MPSLPCVVAFSLVDLKTFGPLVLRSSPFYLVHPGLVCCGGYFFGEPLDRNWTVTLSPIGNCCVVSFRSITASRMSRSLLSDGSPVEMLFLPIIAEILATDPLSLFPSRASAWITTLCPTETLSTSRSRSEEHTSELQSPYDLVCRLL